MERKDLMFMSREELFADSPKQIAIVTDGCTANEAKNAMDFIMNLVKEGKIRRPGYRHKRDDGKLLSLGFNLHECKFQYPVGDRSKKTEETVLDECNTVEFVRILTVDEVWYFDRGDGALPIDGRLYERLKTMEKPIRFLCRTENNTTWDFYRSLEWIWDDEKEELVEDWCFIGELEPYELSPEELEEMNKKESKHLRSISKEELSIEEYDLVFEAFKLNASAGAAATVCMVRLEDEANEKIHSLMCEISSIIFSIISVETVSKEDLRNASAKLDFIRAEVEEIMDSLEKFKECSEQS